MWNDLELFNVKPNFLSKDKLGETNFTSTKRKQLHLQSSGSFQPLKGGADDHVENKGEKEEKQENPKATHVLASSSWFSHVWGKRTSIAHQLT